MPVIAPLPMEEVDEVSRRRIEAGMATGMYTTTFPLRIMARAPAALAAMDESYKAGFRKSLLDDRLMELLRVRSAQINGCAPCSASRKEETVSDEDVACLADPEAASYSPRERMALRFLTRMANDHHSIGAEAYRELAAGFSTPEIVELGWHCSTLIAAHRFMHTLDVLGDTPPILP